MFLTVSMLFLTFMTNVRPSIQFPFLETWYIAIRMGETSASNPHVGAQVNREVR